MQVRRSWRTSGSVRLRPWGRSAEDLALPLAVGLAAGTLVRFGIGANGIAWAAAQVALVGVAAYDVATRRLPNVVTIPVSIAAVMLRVVFERSEIGAVVVAGAGAFLVFLLFAIVARGGLGMGDVKFAGMLGFLLGGAVVPALAIGIIAGGVVSAALLAGSRVGLRTSIAYGPYLAAGGAVAILAFNPPALV